MAVSEDAKRFRRNVMKLLGPMAKDLKAVKLRMRKLEAREERPRRRRHDEEEE